MIDPAPKKVKRHLHFGVLTEWQQAFYNENVECRIKNDWFCHYYHALSETDRKFFNLYKALSIQNQEMVLAYIQGLYDSRRK